MTATLGSMFPVMPLVPVPMPGFGLPQSSNGSFSFLDLFRSHTTLVRRELEKESKEEYPIFTARRAICYAAKIYNYATHGGSMELDKIDYFLARMPNGETGLRGSEQLLSAERSYTYKSKIHGVDENITLTDSRPGCVIIRTTGVKHGREWNTVYVVFRGSRGSAPDEGPKAKNPCAAGWSQADDSGNPSQNVDWTCNFDNQQVAFLYGQGADVRVHRGFATVYMSLRQRIVSTLQGLTPDNVVVTGHSLGGGLATICAYDLCRTLPDTNVVCHSFNAPRAGNEAFARDFNRRLSNQSYMPANESGVFKRAFRFDQKNDPVTYGQEAAFEHSFIDHQALPIHLRGKLKEAGIDKKMEKNIAAGSMIAAAHGARKDLSKTQIFYHVQNRKTVSFFGLHSFTAMLDTICGSGASKMLGIHD